MRHRRSSTSDHSVVHILKGACDSPVGSVPFRIQRVGWLKSGLCGASASRLDLIGFNTLDAEKRNRFNTFLLIMIIYLSFFKGGRGRFSLFAKMILCPEHS